MEDVHTHHHGVRNNRFDYPCKTQNAICNHFNPVEKLKGASNEKIIIIIIIIIIPQHSIHHRLLPALFFKP
jgi:hypothetical protein